MSLGRYLVQARELRGMSLVEVAAQTKIPRTTLEALEADAEDRLPDRVYVMGFLRAYADALGLDEDDLLLRYEEEVGPLEPPAEAEARASRRGRLALVALLAVLVVGGLALLLLLK